MEGQRQYTLRVPERKVEYYRDENGKRRKKVRRITTLEMAATAKSKGRAARGLRSIAKMSVLLGRKALSRSPSDSPSAAMSARRM